MGRRLGERAWHGQRCSAGHSASVVESSEPSGLTFVVQDESCIARHLGERAPRGNDGDASPLAAGAGARSVAVNGTRSADRNASASSAVSAEEADKGKEAEQGGVGDSDGAHGDDVSVASSFEEEDDTGRDVSLGGDPEQDPGVDQSGSLRYAQASLSAATDGSADGQRYLGVGQSDRENPEPPGNEDVGEPGVRRGTGELKRGSSATGSGLGSGLGQSALDAYMDGAADPLRRHYQRCADWCSTQYSYILIESQRCPFRHQWLLKAVEPSLPVAQHASLFSPILITSYCLV